MKIIALALAACSAFAATPYSGDLAAQIRATAPTWFGYTIQSVKTNHNGCCCDWRAQHTVKLEGDTSLNILFRVENNRVVRINGYSRECELDSSGLPLVWISGVPAAASLAYLRTFVSAASANEILDGAIMAIAQHDDARADAMLDEFSRAAEPAHIREKAIFWIGAARGAAGLLVLKQIAGNDPSDNIRDKAIFALFVNGQPESIEVLMHAAKFDPSPHVRGQALFWLAQKAGDRAASAIQGAIDNDPDTEVKKKAVFALSQLPKDQGVPKLIEVARSQRNPEVRKQAFFWLGQSGDPRALAFIEQTLTR